MFKVYANENRMLAGNIKNILTSNGIQVIIKNEFASSVIGEVSPLDSWIELWVKTAPEAKEAKRLLDAIEQETEDWVCKDCGEHNGSAFEICWNCQGPA